MASDDKHLQRLQEELDEAERPVGPITMAEAVALASALVQKRSQQRARPAPVPARPGPAAPAQRSPGLATIAAAGAAVAVGSAWLVRRRRRKLAAKQVARQTARQARKAVAVEPQPVVVGVLPARPPRRLRRNRGAARAANPEPSQAPGHPQAPG